MKQSQFKMLQRYCGLEQSEGRAVVDEAKEVMGALEPVYVIWLLFKEMRNHWSFNAKE